MLVPSDEVFALRKATTDDLNDLANITCAAMPKDLQWDYCFPHRKKYPEDHWNGTRLMLKNPMETTDILINVITVPCKEDGETNGRSIALAVWELSGCKTGFSLGSAGCENRRDADLERMKIVTERLSFVKKNWFDELDGTEQLHLKILATHPDYQRRGAATQHCEWGMKLAKEQEVPITLFCSPEGAKLAKEQGLPIPLMGSLLGKTLFGHIGFRYTGSVLVPVEGQEGKLAIAAMYYQETRVVR